MSKIENLRAGENPARSMNPDTQRELRGRHIPGLEQEIEEIEAQLEALSQRKYDLEIALISAVEERMPAEVEANMVDGVYQPYAVMAARAESQQ